MKLADHLLGRPVEEWVRERRPETSWRQIANELRDVTSGVVDVSGQALINWCGEREPNGDHEPAKAAS